LTRQQAVMFTLSDMMTHVEVGMALARKAFRLTKGNDAQAEKIRAMARVFAGEVTRVVGENALRIVTGTAAVDQAGADQFLAQIGYQQMLGSRLNWVADMDKIADIIFER
jgi:alkylation response protein AidB-like acyl-CoA dehydrogenase